MKKAAGVCMLLCFLLLFPGCGKSYEADVATLFVSREGSIVAVDIEPFDQGKYKDEELEKYVDGRIEEYCNKNGKDAVKKKELTVKENRAVLTLQYQTTQDYMGFMGIPAFSGSISDAKKAGYAFDTAFASIEKGKKVGTVQAASFQDNTKLMVFIVKANLDVEIDGEIMYLSETDVSLTGKDRVSIGVGKQRETVENEQYTYIIYKK